MLKGSCLCGGIKYEVSCDIDTVIKCHCQKCRKSNGTAFGTNSPIKADSFKLLGGKDALAGYKSTPDLVRYFCRNCGSPIYSQRLSTPELVRLRIGTLDTPISAKPAFHIYVGSKAEWDEICDDLPQHLERA
ncbi:MAG: GFA family protein [Proteobacteria bacterium]|nr:GFA family protein [Pseudomonadota bacterium]